MNTKNENNITWNKINTIKKNKPCEDICSSSNMKLISNLHKENFKNNFQLSLDSFKIVEKILETLV